MKRFMILALTLCLLVPAASAFADDGGWIIGVKAGYGWGDVGGGASDTSAAANTTKSDFDDEDGWTGSVALGYDWSGMGVDLRTELEYSMYSDIDYDAQNSTVAGFAKMNADIDVQTIMFNLYYDFENSTSFTPYIGLGAGYAMIDCDVNYGTGYNAAANVADGNADTTNFAWSATAGLAYELTEMIDLDFQVRYVDFGDTDTYETGAYKFKATNLSSTDALVGLRFTF